MALRTQCATKQYKAASWKIDASVVCLLSGQHGGKGAVPARAWSSSLESSESPIVSHRAVMRGK